MKKTGFWVVHNDGKNIVAGSFVAAKERLNWFLTIGVGLQHVVAMFGATFLVPLLTGFPPATTLFFSGIGTLLFIVITGGKVPSYLGSSFAFIAPIAAAQSQYSFSAAIGGVVMAGVALALVGVLIHFCGSGWVNFLMPPVVTGTIVALIGFNLAPSAKNNFSQAPVTAFVTLLSIVLCSVVFRGILGRLSIIFGVVLGYFVAVLRGEVDFSAVDEAKFFGLPEFAAPTFHVSLLGVFVPVILVLVAENIGHVKSIAQMTGDDLDPLIGRSLFADGLATTLAGFGGGSGTTTYAENIGVMAATKIYSTAAYVVAGCAALFLSLSPKFGQLVATVPVGVLGGAATVLYGMIGVLGARIWVSSKVDFADPVNLTTAGVALIVGIADYSWGFGALEFGGIALGTVAAIVVFHLMTCLGRWRGTVG